MQKGRVYRKGASWILAYNVKELRNGAVVWAHRSKRLAPVCDEFRTPASVRHLAAEILAPHNVHADIKAEITDTVAHFLEHAYLPHCQQTLRPSTNRGYAVLFRMLQPHLGNKLRVRDFSAVDGQRLLTDFASANRAKGVVKNAKQFMSGAFRYAVLTGSCKFNPMRETLLPKNLKEKSETHAYSLAEIRAMLEVLDEPSRTVVLTAAFTGLRMAELRGLKWEDFSEDILTVRRSVWQSHIGETKTPGSASTVPLLPIVAAALKLHRQRSVGDFVFVGARGKPMILVNLARRYIRPILAAKGIPWHGWHGFRRGLASNLHELGVQDKTTQAILRHENVQITQKHYIKTHREASVAAMRKLEEAFLARTATRTAK